MSATVYTLSNTFGTWTVLASVSTPIDFVCHYLSCYEGKRGVLSRVCSASKQELMALGVPSECLDKVSEGKLVIGPALV